MAFIQQGNTVYSFADYDDVLAKDTRVFQANESLTETVVEDAVVRSTQRILNQIRSTSWWKDYYRRQGGTDIAYGETITVAEVNPALIISRRTDFTDLCVYHAMSEYLLPKVADFGDETSSERAKVAFYNEKYRELFREIIDAGDWYDFDADGTIETTEKFPIRSNLVRVR